MARTLKRFKPTQGRYPWAKWTDGRVWELTRGRDFHCSIEAISSSLYNRAYRQNLEVNVARKGNRVSFQYHKK